MPEEIDQDAYDRVIDQLLMETELVVEQEQDGIVEFYDDEVPLFKLIYAAADDENRAMILVSFQLEITAPESIMWYTKLRELVPSIHLTSSYFKNDAGDTYLGQDAHVAFRQKIEAEVVAELRREAAKRKNAKSKAKASSLAATDDAENALIYFDQWDPSSKKSN